MYRNTHATVGQNQGHVRPLSVVRCQWQRTTDDGPRTSSSLRLLPSPFRLGLSLTEVLIAMGILTIGLLGVASVFPVGSFYMQKGEIADRGSAIAQAAFNDALVRGYLNPENWLAFEDTFSGPVIVSIPGGSGSRFTRPYADRMRRYRAGLTNRTPSFSPVELERRFEMESGTVFVIDPIGVSGITQVDTAGLPVANVVMRVGSVFPASRALNAGIPNTVPVNEPWHPWSDNWTFGPRWPVRRVTLGRPNPQTPFPQPLDPTAAAELFSSADDLSLDLPNPQDRPAVQPWRMVDADNDGDRDDPLNRMARGNYSWAITVAPTTSEARNALIADPSGHSYEVSVVVFFKRPVSSLAATSNDDALSASELLRKSERAASAKIISTGLSGGQVLLTRQNATGAVVGIEPEESPFNILKVGNWVMLCGPHPSSTNERPMMASHWYKVVAVEGKDQRIDEEGNPTTTTEPERRLVSLRGPQWPWQPANDLTDYDLLSNQLYVCIPAGAVAVHSKTIRFEGNSVHNGGVNSLTSK